jgi:hypothetical protein
MIELVLSYHEDTIFVSWLLVKFHNQEQAKQEEALGWRNLVQKLPLTYFVKNPWEQLVVWNQRDEPVPKEALSISLL